MISILSNIPSLIAENDLNSTNDNMQTTLEQLASGQRINSGAEDPAGLAIANGLEANISALNQSVQNASDGVGALQVADGALSQVTNLLNTAVTLATEASTGTVSSSQQSSLNAEYQQILQEITRIGNTTTFNGTSVFTNTITSVFLSDGVTNSEIGAFAGTLSPSGLGLTGDLTSTADAQSSLSAIDSAINTVASSRGSIGAGVNRLQDATNVMNSQVQNLTSAENQIMAADIPQTVSNMSEYSVLEQTGMAALAQANNLQQNVLTLLK